MSVGKQLHQTLASLRGTKADMKTYALSTEDKNAQKMYSDYGQQLNTIINGFEGRFTMLKNRNHNIM